MYSTKIWLRKQKHVIPCILTYESGANLGPTIIMGETWPRPAPKLLPYKRHWTCMQVAHSGQDEHWVGDVSNRQHLCYDGCLEVRVEIVRTVLCTEVVHSQSTLRWAVLTVFCRLGFVFLGIGVARGSGVQMRPPRATPKNFSRHFS